MIERLRGLRRAVARSCRRWSNAVLALTLPGPPRGPPAAARGAAPPSTACCCATRRRRAAHAAVPVAGVGHGARRPRARAGGPARRRSRRPRARRRRGCSASRCRAPGDWARRNPAPPGGWYFEHRNELYPDVDDTCMALMVLRQARADGARGDAGGGDRARARLDAGDAEPRRRLGRLRSRQRQGLADPRAVRRSQRDDRSQHRRHHRPRARVSGLLPRLRRPRTRWSRARCSSCAATRSRDGAWYGRWGVNYIYGTWQVLRGLACVGEDMTRAVRAPRRRAGCSRTRTPTAAGARASPATTIPSKAGRGASTPSQTAWAVMGLVAAGEERSTAVRNGMRAPARTPGPGGTWSEDGVDRHRLSQGLLSRYHLYRHTSR